MYKGFNLLLKAEDFSEFKHYGDNLTSTYRKAVQSMLDSFLTDVGVIDGSKLQEDWFPQVKANVFISHSHNDEDIAIALAGWLKRTFQLDAFIDSCVWGYADHLLRQIDNKYCLNTGGQTYNYKKRNGSTSHVHMMLSTALGKMIDNTECLIFLNTPNAITTENAVSETQSPWLFNEIAMTKIVRSKRPQRNIFFKGMTITNEKKEKGLPIKYEVDMTPLTKIDRLRLNQWENTHRSSKLVNQSQHPLDTLYSIV